MAPIKQLLFDCDNTLVLSEDLAFEVCADLTNDLLERHSIPDRYTGDMLIVDFIGQSFRGMMGALQEKFNFKMTPEEVDYYVRAEQDAVCRILEAKGDACEGANQVLEKIACEGKYKMAVVSSSVLHRIQVSIQAADQDQYFAPDHVYSASTSLEKPATKPNPAIYFHAMEKLGVKPEECVAVEDSKSGAIAAVRAGVKCIAYVGSYQGQRKQDIIAQTLTNLGCKAVMRHWSEFERCLADIEAQ